MFLLSLACSLNAQTRPDWLQIANKPVIYVSDYGAVGDGVTDDTDAIDEAISALSGGGTLVFASGKNYHITSSLIFPYDNIVVDFNNSQVSVSGSLGSGFIAGPVLVFSKLSVAESVAFGSDWTTGELLENVRVQNFVYRGTFTGVATSSDLTDFANFTSTRAGICFAKVKNFVVDNVEISAVTGTGINAIGCTGYNVIQNAKISNVRYHAICSQRYPGSEYAARDILLIENCYFENIAGYVLDYHQKSSTVQEYTGVMLKDVVAVSASQLYKNQSYLDGGYSNFFVCDNVQFFHNYDYQSNVAYSAIYSTSSNDTIIKNSNFQMYSCSVATPQSFDAGKFIFECNTVEYETSPTATASNIIQTGASRTGEALTFCSVSNNYFSCYTTTGAALSMLANTDRLDVHSNFILYNKAMMYLFQLTGRRIDVTDNYAELEAATNTGILSDWGVGEVISENVWYNFSRNTFRIKNSHQPFLILTNIPGLIRVDNNTFITDKSGTFDSLCYNIASASSNTGNLIASYTP